MVEKKKTLGQKRGWIEPLFTDMDFTAQWKELEKLMQEKTIRSHFNLIKKVK
jgi:hypothetical protein